MSDQGNSQAQDAAPAPQPVNEGVLQADPTELSSLARYRAAQQASAPVAPVQQNAGNSAPTDGQTNSDGKARSEYIPRDRFDQVNQAKNEAEAELARYRQQAALTGMQVYPQNQQVPAQVVSPTGMANPQPQQVSQPGQQIPDFNDPAVRKIWQDKIANNPITGLREFVSLLIQSEGAPLLQQFQQQIMGSIAPIQQTFVSQQLSAYASSRASDPNWTQIQPSFNALAQEAINRGYSPTPEVLSVVEAIARQQVGIPAFSAPQPAAPPVPFSERPGSGGGNFGEAPTPALTPRERFVAQQFGMTEKEYADSKATYRRA